MADTPKNPKEVDVFNRFTKIFSKRCKNYSTNRRARLPEKQQCLWL